MYLAVRRVGTTVELMADAKENLRVDYLVEM